MVGLETDDGQRLLALNDVHVRHEGPWSARWSSARARVALAARGRGAARVVVLDLVEALPAALEFGPLLVLAPVVPASGAGASEGVTDPALAPVPPPRPQAFHPRKDHIGA